MVILTNQRFGHKHGSKIFSVMKKQGFEISSTSAGSCTEGEDEVFVASAIDEALKLSRTNPRIFGRKESRKALIPYEIY